MGNNNCGFGFVSIPLLRGALDSVMNKKSQRVLVFQLTLLLPYISFFSTLFVGEQLAELLGLSACLFACLPFLRFKANRNILLLRVALLLFVYVLLRTLFLVFANRLDISSLFFLIHWAVPLLFIYLSCGDVTDAKRNHAIALMKAVAVFAAVAGIYGIGQILGLFAYPPLDGFRAPGLSRHVLMYSSIQLVAFYANELLVILDGKFAALRVPILMGIIASLSRGAIVSVFFYFGVLFLQIIGRRRFSCKPMQAAVLLIGLLAVFMVLVFAGNAIFPRIASIVNFSTDESNVSRFDAWISFLGQFDFLGAGAGTSGSAASKFGHESAYFESYLLGLIYQAGTFQLLFFATFIATFFKIAFENKIVKNQQRTPLRGSLDKVLYFRGRGLLILSALALQLLTQASFENPTSASLLWLVICCYFITVRSAFAS